ncbi:unnamed protein product [Parascedosporium putredinis]|uniref:Pseudouridine synthase RsuA/RluA-like domain-containing protein n=1 Tax=Parascedosporium putredinis TaxID=1442378 RepID=A0A9P1M9S4_9PEZI|nr:unnamed protein product [Parascedosporium putredinis]CAI7995356.1 unnamed protein product [Parascedosporium putredinis]
MSDTPAAGGAAVATVPAEPDALVDVGPGPAAVPLPPIEALALVKADTPTETAAASLPSNEPTPAPPASAAPTVAKTKTKKRKVKNPRNIPTTRVDRPADYYVRAIANGTVQVNAPVSGEPVRVLHEDDGMLVIVKPAGIPVHPAGRYGYNSVLEILKDERGRDFVPHPCHRLDRLTSGIMFIAKNPEAAEGLRAQIAGRTVRKEYIARVIGEFPDGEVVCDQPILQISPKLGLNRVDLAAADRPEGASAERVQGKPWLGKQGYSIVRCLPITGRTHQIRVHLQYIDGVEHADEDVISRLERMGKEEAADAVAYHDEMVDEYEKRRAEMMTGKIASLRYQAADGSWGYITPLPKWALPSEGIEGPVEVGSLDALINAANAAGPIDL